ARPEPPPPRRRRLAASSTLLGVCGRCIRSRPTWGPLPRLVCLGFGGPGGGLIGGLQGLLHRLAGLRSLVLVHVRRCREILYRLALGRGLHVVSPCQGRISATEERVVARPGVVVKIPIAVAAGDVHDSRGDLPGV